MDLFINLAIWFFIQAIHLMWIFDSASYLKIILIYLSYIVFLVITITHTLSTSTTRDNKYRKLSIGDLRKLQDQSIIRSDNNAILLILKTIRNIPMYIIFKLYISGRWRKM